MTSTIILSSYVALVLFFILPKVVLTFESVDKVPEVCMGAVNYARYAVAQTFESVDKIL